MQDFANFKAYVSLILDYFVNNIQIAPWIKFMITGQNYTPALQEELMKEFPIEGEVDISSIFKDKKHFNSVMKKSKNVQHLQMLIP